MGGLDVALYAEALFSSATSLGISVCRLTLELPPQPAVECCSQPQPSLLHRLFPRALCRQRQVGAQQSASSGEGGEADVLLGELLDCFEGSGSCCKFAALGCTTLLLAPAPSGGAEEAAPAVSAAAASQHSGPTNSAAHGAGVPASTCTPQLVATLQKQRLRRSMAALAGRVSGMNAAQPPQPGLVLGRRDATLSVLELKQRRPRAFVPARLAVRLARAAMAATKWVFAELAASGALHFLASYLVLRLFKAWAAG